MFVNRNDLPENVRRLIRDCVPTIDALEILLYLVRRADSLTTSNEIVTALLPTRVSESIVKDYLALLTSQGIITEARQGFFVYAPSSRETAQDIEALAAAYNQRPVTLVRTVYSIAESRSIRHFADAFRIRKSP
jgi:hypothetical protein